MTDNSSGGWRNFQPTKGALVWSFFGGVVATLIVGFAVFDWYTAGGAHTLARDSAEEAQAELASAICVERFMTAPDAATHLADLKEEGTWSRDDFIEEGGWVTFARLEDPVSGAAELCADKLVEMKAPAKSAASTTAVDG
jgi:hypothetical protein